MVSGLAAVAPPQHGVQEHRRRIFFKFEVEICTFWYASAGRLNNSLFSSYGLILCMVYRLYDK